jgi:hypothetical protein
MLVYVFMDHLKCLDEVQGFFFLFSISLDGKRGQGFLHLIVVTDRAIDDARGFLLLKRSAILEPALKFMAVGAEEVKSDHLGQIPSSKCTSIVLSFYHIVSTLAIRVENAYRGVLVSIYE